MKFNISNCLIKIDFSIILIISLALFANNYDILFLIIFSSLHETGHLISLLLLGEKPCQINLSFYGIGLKHNAKLSFINEILFLFAGVLVNFIFVIFDIKRYINLCLLAVNIIPIYPLDGGRILYLVLEQFEFEKSYKIFVYISLIVIFVMLILAIYLKNFNLIVITIYVFSFWIKEVIYD